MQDLAVQLVQRHVLYVNSSPAPRKHRKLRALVSAVEDVGKRGLAFALDVGEVDVCRRRAPLRSGRPRRPPNAPTARTVIDGSSRARSRATLETARPARTLLQHLDQFVPHGAPPKAASRCPNDVVPRRRMPLFMSMHSPARPYGHSSTFLYTTFASEASAGMKKRGPDGPRGKVRRTKASPFYFRRKIPDFLIMSFFASP